MTQISLCVFASSAIFRKASVKLRYVAKAALSPLSISEIARDRVSRFCSALLSCAAKKIVLLSLQNSLISVVFPTRRLP